MNTCVPYYCENGYVFNKNTKKCEIDLCYEEEDTSSESKNDIKNITIVILSIISVIFLTLFILAVKGLLCFKKKASGVEKNEIFEISLN